MVRRVAPTTSMPLMIVTASQRTLKGAAAATAAMVAAVKAAIVAATAAMVPLRVAPSVMETQRQR